MTIVTRWITDPLLGDHHVNYALEVSSAARLACPAAREQRQTLHIAWCFVLSERACRRQRGCGEQRRPPVPCHRSAPLHIRFVQCCTEPACELLSIVVRPEVHEEEPGLVIQHVIMERGHLDAASA